jgi:hypothetical protein
VRIAPSKPNRDLRGLFWLPKVTAVAVAAATACSSPAGPAAPSQLTEPPPGAVGVSSNTELERYFPLIDGTVFAYETESADGDRGRQVARVHRTDATHGELVYPDGRKRYMYSPTGIRVDPTGELVLAPPLTVGGTFRGQHGLARIEDVDASIEVRAGSFKHCLRLVEERGGDRRARFVTTFCPDVGVVAIEATSGTAYERAELVSTGPPVRMQADGTTITRGAPPP